MAAEIVAIVSTRGNETPIGDLGWNLVLRASNR
jgi:hypothetical protein